MNVDTLRMNRSQYLFGDSDIAAQRLQLLASIYRESTRAFLLRAAGSIHFPLALDLGCGPGFTTRLIAETLRCDRVAGLDVSAGFIESARANSDERTSFLQHDVTIVPFPRGRANLIFARCLLSHFRDSAGVVAKWATQLEPRGLLLLEETEAIHTRHAVFTRYLGIVEAMLSAQSNQLYAGHMLAGLNLPAELKQMTGDLRPLPVRSSDAARMFVLNLRSWKENQFIRANYAPDSVSELEDELTQIAVSESSSREIEWLMRQTAWLRE
jgi:trans-aconitate 2-methyltransferase